MNLVRVLSSPYPKVVVLVLGEVCRLTNRYVMSFMVPPLPRMSRRWQSTCHSGPGFVKMEQPSDPL